jgi:hypothetical protein
MDHEAYAASGFEHRTESGVLWQKRALGLAARSQANAGPEGVGKQTYFHLRSIAPSFLLQFPKLRPAYPPNAPDGSGTA